MKRTLVLILTILMCLSMFVACADPSEGGEGSTEGTTEKAEVTPGIENEYNETDRLPAELNFGGQKEVTIFHWSDYSMLEFEFDSDGGSGDLVEDALVARNNAVEQRLGVKLMSDETEGRSGKEDVYIKAVENDHSADKNYDIYAGYSRVLPTLQMRGYLLDLNSTKYFDSERPWWPKALTEEITINNKLYFCSGDISTQLLWMMTGVFWNLELYEDYYFGQKSPYDMLDANEWTMDALFGLTKNIWTDGGDKKKSEDDTFGLVAYEVNIDAFQQAAGIIAVERDGDGMKISDKWHDANMINLVDDCKAYFDTEGVYHTNDTTIRNIFFEQRSLFMIDRVFVIAGKDNASDQSKIEFDYGMVPVPMYDATTQKDQGFTTSVGHPFTMYGIRASAANNENDEDCFSAVIECMGAEGYRRVTPAVFETAMKLKYTSDTQAGRSFDALKEGISFDIGRLYCDHIAGGITASLFRNSALGKQNFGQVFNMNFTRGVFSKALETIEASYMD